MERLGSRLTEALHVRALTRPCPGRARLWQVPSQFRGVASGDGVARAEAPPDTNSHLGWGRALAVAPIDRPVDKTRFLWIEPTARRASFDPKRYSA